MTYVFADVNECEHNQHDCDDNATCTNTPGSFLCTCNKGYGGNGTICEGTVLVLIIIWFLLF